MIDRIPGKEKNAKAAAAVAFLFGLFVHFFTLVNVLHNYDSIATPAGFAAGATSGRWFLELMGTVTAKFLVNNYNLPWLDGVLFLAFLSVAVYFLVSVLEIKKPAVAIATGMLFVSFPTVASTLFFRFTAVYYGIGILMAVLAAWVLNKGKFGLPVSAVLTACSLGIYQAYMPMTVAIFVVVLLRQTLEGEESVKRLFRKGVYSCASIVLGLLGYFAMTKVSLAVLGVELDTYQGLDQMGSLQLTQLPRMVVNAFLTFFTAPRSDYDLIQNSFMQLLYAGLLLSTAVLAVYLLMVRRRGAGAALFTAFLLAVFPIAVNLITIMSPDSFIYTIMVYSFVLVPVLPLVLLDVLLCRPEGERLPGRAGRKLLLAAAAALIFCNTYFTNLNYQMQHYATVQAGNYASGLVVQARMTEGFTPEKKWAFLGKIDDPLLDNIWVELDSYFAYGGNRTAPGLLRNYSWSCWLTSYAGYSVPEAEEEEVEALSRLEEVREMPCWPAEGSMKVIDEYLVIKFQELTEAR